MLNQKILNRLAVFSSAYLKRWLEAHLYDRIFDTQFGQRLTALDEKAKYGIEFGLNLLLAFFEQKLSEDTPLKKFFREVAIDAGPELSSRLINNAKEKLGKKATSPEERGLVSVLLQLEDKTLIDLLNWLYSIEESERVELLRELSRLSVDEIVKVAQLAPDDKKRLFDLIYPPRKAKEKRSLLSPKAVQPIEAATARLQQVRKKLRERREAR